jgi:hypothetical protein
VPTLAQQHKIWRMEERLTELTGPIQQLKNLLQIIYVVYCLAIFKDFKVLLFLEKGKAAASLVFVKYCHKRYILCFLKKKVKS